MDLRVDKNLVLDLGFQFELPLSLLVEVSLHRLHLPLEGLHTLPCLSLLGLRLD